MSALIDRTFINYLSTRLERFKWIRGSVAVAKCPFCGDGKRGSKTRFYIYQDVRYSTYAYNVNCKNCGHSESFRSFLKDFDATMFSDYRMALFREKYGRDPKGFFSDVPDYVKEDMEKKTEVKDDGLEFEKLKGCIAVSDLPDGHICKVYVEGRMIPKEFWGKLFYTDNFRSNVADFVNEEYAEKMPEDERLIIPFISPFGEVLCFQGRSLDPGCKMRYISVKKNDSIEKVFGFDRIDRSKPVVVVEGPIDSLFIENCVASADADLLRIKGDVYVFDCQYRNLEVCKLISSAIEKGVKVVLFPEEFPFKDINDAVLGGMTLQDIDRLIKQNTFSGLRAKLKFSKLRKC